MILTKPNCRLSSGNRRMFSIDGILLTFLILASSLTNILAQKPSRGNSQSGGGGILAQSFLREPFDQIAAVGEHVTLPCRVVNKRGVLQWTRDDFGLGSERQLIGFDRYQMTGSDEEGKTIKQLYLII
jgi:hypothetical protein